MSSIDQMELIIHNGKDRVALENREVATYDDVRHLKDGLITSLSGVTSLRDYGGYIWYMDDIYCPEQATD